ncbi:hypothetical protein UK12_22705 [Saccharothrix sp. ST-888]|nr:hypothetical protein UK12_22705 [Saccharothrix sp. ST-888]
MEGDRRAARQLASRTDQMGRIFGREPWREILLRISGGRLGRRTGPTIPLQLQTPWQDTLSPLRTGWRQRAADLHGESVFAIDYQVCRPCSLAWAEEPHTDPSFQRCGPASAGVAALRAEHPGLAWHTLGGRFAKARPFRTHVGTGVPGGYQSRRLCGHATAF